MILHTKDALWLMIVKCACMMLLMKCENYILDTFIWTHVLKFLTTGFTVRMEYICLLRLTR